MIKDFLRALSDCLRNCLGGEYPLYFGRTLQGAKRPCLVLTPPRVRRKVLSAGRVEREYEVNLRFYPGAASDLFEQQRVGEKLICALEEIFGEDRNYRGRELEYVPQDEYLTVLARYDLITLKSLEQSEDGMLDRAFMQEFGFELAVEAAE